VKQTLVIGSPELAAYLEAQEDCAESDVEFPYRGFADFRNAVGYRPTPESMLLRVEGEPAEFAWV
jgi:hypothetical protein